MNNHVNGATALVFNVIEGHVSRASECKVGESANRSLGIVCVEGGQRALVPGVQCVEQYPCLRAANFANDDPVGPMAERRLEQVGEADRTLVSVELGLGGDDVRLPDMQFSGVLEYQDALTVGNETGKHISSVVFPVPVPPRSAGCAL